LEEYRTVKPFHINIPEGGIPDGVHTNEVSEPYNNIQVHDIRTEPTTAFSLDKQGFEVAVAEGTTESAVVNAVTPDKFACSDSLQSALAPATEAFLKERLRAETVFTFACRV
jgi:hypothetical protein